MLSLRNIVYHSPSINFDNTLWSFANVGINDGRSVLSENFEAIGKQLSRGKVISTTFSLNHKLGKKANFLNFQ